MKLATCTAAHTATANKSTRGEDSARRPEGVPRRSASRRRDVMNRLGHRDRGEAALPFTGRSLALPALVGLAFLLAAEAGCA